MALARRSIVEILRSRGKLTDEQLKEAMKARRDTTQPIEEILIQLGIVSKQDILSAKAEQLGVEFVDLSQIQIDESAMGLVPRELMEKYRAVPIRIEGNRLTVAMANPRDLMAIDDLRMRTRLNIRPVLADPEAIDTILSGELTGAAVAGGSVARDIEAALRAMEKESAGKESRLGEELAAAGHLADLSKLERVSDEALADEAPVIRIVNLLFKEAIRNNASDIHVEPQRKDVRIRMRIDGVLHEFFRLPKWIHAPLIARIKILADMDIAEKRIPQDGRIQLRMAKKLFDVRVSTIPTTNGEKAVLRLLDQTSVLIGLDKLGLFPDDVAKIEYLISQPNGMILSTGPTGSGKTTTQYSIMHRLNTTEVNIITIEDPVEYQLPGLNQVHVNRKAGLTFATALRSFLRQDPDIIMVGEIRDLETADIAIQAALTGHLVLSTLHTNDAPTAITRLIEMGVEPFLIAASVIGVIAQRLARRICPNCKEEYEPPPELLARFGYQGDGDQKFYRGRGCEICRQTGYKGRIGIFEIFVMNQEIADLVLRRAPLTEIRDAAVASGMKTLLEDGFRKVLAGITTPEEVLRVVATAGY
ncbi:MAG: hypothetical protein GDYSWBUE_000155 [Candidatus Fervidibacterota bacterium]